MSFSKKLSTIWHNNNSLVCVGLDPDISRFPHHLKKESDSIFKFNKAIIDSTHDLVCAYKPQIAYFAAASAETQLEKTIDYIKSNYPDVPVILDAKRGDIGSTAEMYAKEVFVRYNADAVTINPYLGLDSVEPFLRYEDRGIILLCRTTNSGANDIQDLIVDGEPVYKKVAKLISEKWNYNKNCLLVVGATGPAQMSEIRDIDGNMVFLVPGIGAQGGDIEKIVSAGQTSTGAGLIISSSRAILYASSKEDFAEAARNATQTLRNTINNYRTTV
ncbi:MAG: orotidine-5'-phosphate decarboxylase [Proteobacteria bacterium]|nr:orotidine-5'-phosphate decarboxylase [Pseudomonadota bacterium]